MKYSKDKRCDYDPRDCNLEERVNTSLLLAGEVLEILFTVKDIDACACEAFTIKQLEVARLRAQELSVLLDRILICLTFTDITFPYYSIISTSTARVSQAVEGLTLLQESNYCSNPDEECKVVLIFAATLLDVQTVLNNLIAVSKLIMMERRSDRYDERCL